MCPAILKADQIKYISRQRERDRLKYGNGLTPLASLAPRRSAATRTNNGMPAGSALYLPRSRSGSDGQGLCDVISFLSNNASAIKDIACAVSAGVETVGKVATTTTNIFRQLRELKEQGMTNEAIDQVLESGRFLHPVLSPGASGTATEARGVKEGKGFFYVK